MAIDSITSSSVGNIQHYRQQAEQNEVRQTGRDSSRDDGTDDRAAKAAATTGSSAPTRNTDGQTVGTIIDTKA